MDPRLRGDDSSERKTKKKAYHMDYLKNTIRYSTILFSFFLGMFFLGTIGFAARSHYDVYPSYFEALEQQPTSYHRENSIEDLWAAVTQLFSLPHYEASPAVQEQISWFMNHKEFLARVANQAEPYLFYVYQQVKTQRLPGELALLPMIESAYDPFAYSTVGAAGLWQLMPSTATGLGLHQDYWFDGRKDIINSTKAALTHLNYLKNFFHGDWLLAIASYDSGEGTVANAMRRNQQEGLSTKFWSLSLPRETQDYVPRLLALAEIISNPKKYPVELPSIRNEPYFGTVDVDHQVMLSKVAHQAHIKLDDLYQLNPGYNHWATDPDPKSPSRIVLPIENIATYEKALHRKLVIHIEGEKPKPVIELATLSHYRVKSGDTLWSIAKKHHVSPNELETWNHLKSPSALKIGKLLVVSKTAKTMVASKEKNEPSVSQEEKASSDNKDTTENYRIQPGDTLHKIAREHHISLNQLMAENQINSHDVIHPGQLLIVPKIA